MPLVKTLEEGSLFHVILNRPEKLNAINHEILDELDQIADNLRIHPKICCVLVYSSCKKAFSAGADIEEWSRYEPLEMGDIWISKGHEVLDKWSKIAQPVIVVMNGLTLGGGLEFALTADIKIAEKNIRLGFPEASIGAIPGWGGIARLGHAVSPGILKYMVFTAGIFDADFVAKNGLADFIEDTGKGMEKAGEIATKICGNSSVSVRLCKSMANDYLKNQTFVETEKKAATIAGFSPEGQAKIKEFLRQRNTSRKK